MNLIGLDVGFSLKERTSGVACLKEGRLSIGRATCSWQSRLKILGDLDLADVAALDAPILAETASDVRRVCEELFTRGCFQRRCKPGLSDVPGTGRRLREAGQESAEQLSRVTSRRDLRARFPRVWGDHNLVEAFPNAFLGVLLPDRFFCSTPKPPRGKKFDWLYDQCCQEGKLDDVIKKIGPEEFRTLLPSIKSNRNHEERAALICLLTAATVAAGQYTAVGEGLGGYFFLPPWPAWAEWARKELQRQRTSAAEVWINGWRLESSDALPTEE